jgi:hypothetical protein
MAHREYGADAMKKLQAEARARRQAELAEKREAQRQKELAEYEAQKERRHRAWAAKGNHFFERKIAEEKAMEEAAEFRRLAAIRVKKEQEEQKKRLAEAYAARMEAARLVAEAKEREIQRRTRWYDDGSRYVGAFLEEPLYKSGLFNTADRRNKHRTPHGRGTFFVGNMIRYAGEWFYGERHGQGTLNCTDGSVFRGRFSHGQRHGIGVWEYMSAEAAVRMAAAKDAAAKEAYEVTEVFRAPPRKCIFWKDTFVCWWEDLIVGQSIRFCLHNSYNCLSNPQWFHATIVEVIPDGEEDGEERFGAIMGREDEKDEEGGGKGERQKKKGEMVVVGGCDSEDEGRESEDEKEPAGLRPAHWPKNRKLKHRIQCLDEKPWRVLRWIDVGKIQFRLAERNGKSVPLCNLPIHGLQEFPARKDHTGRLEHVSDPLTDAFKQHIRFKLENVARRDGMVAGRETLFGAAGSGGAPGVYKLKYK